MTVKAIRNYRQGPETERLLLRAFIEEDAEAMLRMTTDPDVVRYTGDESLGSVEAARAAIRDYPDWDRYGYGRWAAVLKSSGDVIGFAGLKHLEDLGEVDLGYRFFPEHWGKGLATEASLASLRFAFDSIGLDEVIAMAMPGNLASIRVMQKVGMRRRDPFTYDGFLVEKYSVSRADFCRVAES